MLTVDDYGAIRRARRDGMSIRQISREFGHTRKTVRHVARPCRTPGPDQLGTREGKAPLLGPGRRRSSIASSPTMRRLLPSSGTPPPRSIAASARSTPTPAARPRSSVMCSSTGDDIERPSSPSGTCRADRLEADFGHIHVDFLHVDFPRRSQARPVPRRRLGLLQCPVRPGPALRADRGHPRRHGRRLRVLRRRAPGSLVGQPQDRRHPDPQGARTPGPSTLRGAWPVIMFSSRKFCMPARGNEKPDAESTVKAVQKRFATPVPRVADLEDLNVLLRQLVPGRTRPGRSVARRAVHDQGSARRGSRLGVALAPGPVRGLRDPFRRRTVDKYQSVAFDGNRYSVPRAFALRAWSPLRASSTASRSSRAARSWPLTLDRWRSQS